MTKEELQKQKKKESDRLYRQKNKKARVEYLNKWREENRDHVNEQARGYYANEPEKRVKRAQKYCKDNPEKVRARRKKYREENKERRNQESKEYCRKHRDRLRKLRIRQRLLHPEKVKLRDRIRHAVNIAKKFNCEIGDAKLIGEFYHKILSSESISCYYCKNQCGSKCFVSVEIDHKYPLCKGGAHDISNFAISCKTCNVTKGKMTESEFREYLTIVEEVRQELGL